MESASDKVSGGRGKANDERTKAQQDIETIARQQSEVSQSGEIQERGKAILEGLGEAAVTKKAFFLQREAEKECSRRNSMQG